MIPPSKKIDLSFDVFELEKNEACAQPDCPCDYVEIREYFSDKQFSFIGRYCMGGNNTPPSLISSAGNKLTVLFHFDTSGGEKGFKASYTIEGKCLKKLKRNEVPKYYHVITMVMA